MAPAPVEQSKTSWADDAELETADGLPKPVETIDADGIKTIVEYKINDAGKKVKVIRRIKRSLVKQNVNHAVAERKAWTKFGLEKGKKPGPDSGTTTIGEAIRIKMNAGNKAHEIEEDETAKLKAQLASKKITCRMCGGDHYTTRCPYKDTLGGVAGVGGDAADEPSVDATPAAAGSGTGKYIPVHLRGGARVGETMNGRGMNRDDLPTLRVTNLSEDANESDLWDLFGRFGRISRIYVGKDQDTGLCKGFAFVSFEDRALAEKAMKKINGMPYDHLILACQWSVPRGERAGEKAA